MSDLLLFQEAMPSGIIPRDYQADDLEESFKQWDSGEIGTLTRCFTGGGKTIMSCLKFRRWLDRGPQYKCMVLSYEQELVDQFAEEIKDVLGISAGIEMGNREIEPGQIPQIIVASRQSLLCRELATQEQRNALAELGLSEIGLLTKSQAKSAIGALGKHADIQQVADSIAEWNTNYRCNAERGRVTRLHKFDWHFNWLVVFDEAHKYKMELVSVGHIVEWFSQNPYSRRSGITATPKRRDKVSIGSTLFPGIALDFPFTKAIKDGYAVPYCQKFIQVESIDFKRLKEACKNQTQWDEALDEILNTEEALATLCEPLLDLVGDRKTLIFSPSVAMAQNVADYINARCECECPSCGSKKWYPNLLLGDGAKCRECGDFITVANAIKAGIQAHSINGGTFIRDRKQVYNDHQSGKFQFLSICGLCREGYNDPDIACVAIFRPVSKAASSLAEQMKGRGSRPKRGCINGLESVAERLDAIAKSGKPDCLIVDLVGVTGLADCASTIQIYAEGFPDETIARAEQIALFGGIENPEEAIAQAQREEADEKERLRIAREAEAQRRREAAERRATLDAEVKYSAHDIGSAQSSANRDPSRPSEKMIRYIHMLGMDFCGWEPSYQQAKRIIGQLTKDKLPPSEVARTNRIPQDCWKRARGTLKQIYALQKRGIVNAHEMTPIEIGEWFKRIKEGKPVARLQLSTQGQEYSRLIASAATHDFLDAAGKKINAAKERGELTEFDIVDLRRLFAKQRNEVF